MLERFKNHPSIVYATQIKQLCEPLHNFNITTFSHLRVFNNNQLTVQCNNSAFLLNYLKEQYYTADPCVNIHSESTNLGEYIIWDSVACSGRTAEMLAASYSYNFKHVFSIIKTQKDYVDFYHFGTHQSNPAIHQTYINNLAILDHFIAFFNSETKKSKELSQAYDIILNANQIYSNVEQDTNDLLFNKQVNRGVILKKLIKSEYGNLTYKEIECSELILQGNTTKEIAKELGLSYRTIEDRINSLKVKLNAKNKADLIVKILGSRKF